MSAGAHFEALQSAVGVAPAEVGFLADARPEDISRLVAMFEAERDRQAQELQDAIENGLGMLPKALRKAVARAFVGLA